MGFISHLFRVRPTVPGVKYKEKELTNGNTYEVYTATSRARALEFLRATDVRKERKYVIVETPDGSIGKDMIMIEATSQNIEFGKRKPLKRMKKSRTHCTKCGYPVFPAGWSLSGAKELIGLDEMMEKGVGFLCSWCATAWCPFCVDTEAPEICQMCGGDLELSRQS
jgi:hypothetical protein